MSADLAEKYDSEKLKAIRKQFDDDVQEWAEVKRQRGLDMQCISTDTGDPNKVAGPWPEEEWRSRHTVANQRPCLHEDVLTPFADQVINDIEQNPMGIETQPSGDGANPQTAQFLENRIRQIEYEEQGTNAYLVAAKNAVLGSYGWFKLETAYRNKFDQKVCIVEIDDPDTIVPGFFKKKDASDMRRCWELERLPIEDFLERYPDAKVRNFAGLDKEAPQWVDSSTVQLAAWWHYDVDEKQLLRIDSPEGPTDIYPDEIEDFDEKQYEGRIQERRTIKRKKVVKTILNGVEVLDETEFIDPGDGDDVPPEIPLFLISGRIKYQDGKRIIDSLIRKGRVGQLLYDYTISAIQEAIGMIPKFKIMGPEGSFDTSTDWARANRNPTAYAEYKLVEATSNGEAAPKPEWVQYDASAVQSLEMAKQSIIGSIQNAIGIGAIETKNALAKSGKALDLIEQQMSVGSSHYFGSTRIAQERLYRMLSRILPLLEKDLQAVAIRDKFGKHQMVQPLYQGRHSVAVGTGKRYQTLQDKQEEAAQDLMKINDPQVLLAVLPGALRMRGLGDYGEQLAKMIETLQPPQMQAARQGQPQQDPRVMAAMQQATQQIQQLRQIIQQMTQEREAKVLEYQSKERMASDDNQTKIAVAEINASVKEDMNTLVQQVQAMKHVMDIMSTRFELEHDANQNALDRTQAQDLAARQAAAAAAQAAQNQPQAQPTT